MRRYETIIKAGGSHALDVEEDDDLFEDKFSIAYNLDRDFGYFWLTSSRGVSNYICLTHSFLGADRG